jgi:spermidine/putrescine transport system permease protein
MALRTVPRRRPSRQQGPGWPLKLYALLAFIFLYAPIVMIIIFSFNQSRLGAVFTGFTLDWYRTLFQNETVLIATRNTLIIAVTSTAIATVIGTLLGVGLARYVFPGKRLFLWFMYVPVVIPEIIMAVSLIIFYGLVSQHSGAWASSLLAYSQETGGPIALLAGALGQLARQVSGLFQLGLATVILAHITFQIPFVAIVVRSRMAGFDRSLEEAARDLGANEVAVFRHVTLPLIMPGVIAAALLAFTLSIDDFVITFFTSGPGAITLPVYIYGSVKRGIRPDINALSTLIVVVTVVALLLSNWIQSRVALSGAAGGSPKEDA